MLGVIGAKSIDDLFVDVPAIAQLDGPIQGLPGHASELAVERHMSALARKNLAAGRCALLPRLRCLQASCAGERSIT